MTAATKISASELAQKHERGEKPAIIDVRTSAEYQASYFPGSRNIPLHDIQAGAADGQLQSAAGEAGEPLYLLCQGGKRAAMAGESLGAKLPNALVLVEGGIAACPPTLLVRGGGNVIALERQVRIAAGLLVLLGVVCGVWLNPAWLGLSAFVGAGLTFAGVTDTCGMALMLARMPWNRAV